MKLNSNQATMDRMLIRIFKKILFLNNGNKSCFEFFIRWCSRNMWRWIIVSYEQWKWEWFHIYHKMRFATNLFLFLKYNIVHLKVILRLHCKRCRYFKSILLKAITLSTKLVATIIISMNNTSYDIFLTSEIKLLNNHYKHCL